MRASSRSPAGSSPARCALASARTSSTRSKSARPSCSTSVSPSRLPSRWISSLSRSRSPAIEPRSVTGRATLAALHGRAGHVRARSGPARVARRLPRSRARPDDGRGAATCAASPPRFRRAPSGRSCATTRTTSLGRRLAPRLIQPGFSFLVGAALPFSLAARAGRGESRGRMLAHALRRALILVALGIVLRSLGRPQTYFTFEDTLTQIGLGYRLPVPARAAPAPRPVVALALMLVGFWARLRALSRAGPGLRLGGGGRARGLAAPAHRLRGALEQERELLGAVRPLVPEPLPARAAVRLQRRRLPDAELHPHARHDDPRPARGRRPAQRPLGAATRAAGWCSRASRASRRAACSEPSACARSSSASGRRASRSGAAASASCSPPSSTRCSTCGAGSAGRSRSSCSG